MEQYETQLFGVEAAIQAAKDESERRELYALKENLIELIALTQYAEEENQTAEGSKEFDQEMQKFMYEIDDIDQKGQDEMDKIKEKFENMVGEKCSAPHMHAWGAVAYHNALICGIQEEAPIDDDGKIDVKLRVLFTNPTHREMLPCSFFLDGNCRFDSENCHYSHGEIVSATSLRKYSEPDFSRLSRNCVVLAKTDDRLWHRGRVLCANYIEKECRVRLDSKKDNEREKDFCFEDLLPIVQDDNESTSDSDSELEYPIISADDNNSFVNTFVYELEQPLGDWEKHTRGIGSKLMAKMGYIYGTGLGSNGRGIITPVTAQILPPGRSLDHCMELREAANGDKDLFSAEKKMQKQQRKQQALSTKSYERENKRSDVFSFINNNILTTPKPSEKNTIPKTSLQNHTSKSLNVETVKVADDIRRKEREISEVQQSLKRNLNGSSEVCNRLRQKLQVKTNELNVLQKEQKCLSKEQANRKTKEKLCVF